MPSRSMNPPPSQGQAAGQRRVFHDPVAPVEGGGAGPGDRNPDKAGVRRELPERGTVPRHDLFVDPAPNVSGGRVPLTNSFRSTPHA